MMTSANLSEEPIAIDNHEAVRAAGKDIADCLLVHNREILIRSDDSVVRVTEGKTTIRRSRGFVPMPVFLDREVPSVLAVGGELKNTICLTRGEDGFRSQHVGDPENAGEPGILSRNGRALVADSRNRTAGNCVRLASGISVD